MKRSRFTEEQIIRALNERATGSKISDICRRHGITATTFHRWSAKYGRMQVNEARKLKALEEENRRLKKLVADLSLDNAMLKDVAGRKW
jgi:putative transposase